MKTRITILGVILLSASLLFGAFNWVTYTADEFNIQFDIPSNWEVEIDNDEDVPSLMASDPDGEIVFMTMAYKDVNITTEGLFDQAVESLDIAIDGEAEEGEHNGMDIWYGYGTSVIEHTRVAIIILAATYDENNYITYLFTELNKFDDNEEIMSRIFESYSPIN